jgi:mannose-6-phosphate isomerase-like protein (cupin superfamily)
MYRLLPPKEIDLQTLKTLSSIPTATRDSTPRKNFDGVVVRKPWGFEYLACESEHVALWALKLRFNQQTSMHCHPEKLTVMLALSDGIVLSTLSGIYKLNTGDVVYIEPGTFHRSSSTNLEGDWLLEFETPVDKFDLVRLDDAYGRSVSSYEGAEHHFRDHEEVELIQWLSRYDYVTPKESALIGDATISFFRINSNSSDLASIRNWANSMNLLVLVSNKGVKKGSEQETGPLEFLSPRDISQRFMASEGSPEFILGIRW